MANSRLEKIGTIFSRVQGLIKSGALKYAERPIWYDIYEKFPPDTPPKFDQKPDKKPIRPIFYAEDQQRAIIDVTENKVYNLFEGRKKFETKTIKEPFERKKLVNAKELLELSD